MGDAGQVEDVRVLTVKYDSTGANARDFKEAVEAVSTDSWQDWPIRGPRTAHWCLRFMQEHGGTPNGWHQRWRADARLQNSDVGVSNHELCCRILQDLCCYDQCNSGNLAAAEHCASLADPVGRGAVEVEDPRELGPGGGHTGLLLVRTDGDTRVPVHPPGTTGLDRRGAQQGVRGGEGAQKGTRGTQPREAEERSGEQVGGRHKPPSGVEGATRLLAASAAAPQWLGDSHSRLGSGISFRCRSRPLRARVSAEAAPFVGAVEPRGTALIGATPASRL